MTLIRNINAAILHNNNIYVQVRLDNRNKSDGSAPRKVVGYVDHNGSQADVMRQLDSAFDTLGIKHIFPDDEDDVLGRTPDNLNGFQGPCLMVDVNNGITLNHDAVFKLSHSGVVLPNNEQIHALTPRASDIAIGNLMWNIERGKIDLRNGFLPVTSHNGEIALYMDTNGAAFFRPDMEDIGLRHTNSIGFLNRIQKPAYSLGNNGMVVNRRGIEHLAEKGLEFENLKDFPGRRDIISLTVEHISTRNWIDTIGRQAFGNGFSR